MQIISQLLERKVVPVVIVTLLTVLTLGTSAMGAAKVAGSLSLKDSDTTKVLGAQISKQESVDENDISGQEKEDQNHAKATNPSRSSGSPKASSNTNLSNGKSVANVTPKANGVVLTSTTTPSTNTNSNACVITIFGKQYDVTSLRSTHSGGDVFVCGTDQSSTYQGKHGTSVARMASYLVTSGTQAGTQPVAQSGATSGKSAVNTGSQNGSGSVQSVSASSRRVDDDSDDDDSETDHDDDDENEINHEED